jgi:hypothetical protein
MWVTQEKDTRLAEPAIWDAVVAFYHQEEETEEEFVAST